VLIPAGKLRTHGFTLIELLAAMAIFSLLAVAMYGGTQWVILERGIIMARQAELHDLQRTVMYLNDDFGQLRARQIRDELGRGSEPPLLTGEGRDYLVELSRDGWRNPANLPRGSLQRVQYRLDEDVLVREYWPVMDRTLGAEGREQELLTGVTEITVEFLDDGGEWRLLWPSAGAPGQIATALPAAVRYRLDTESFGIIERLVEVTR
jgi:general secretion pathway protein J